MHEDEQVPDPLILELVSDGHNVRPVLVRKYPCGVPEYRDTLNQRGKDGWPEITYWPRENHYSLYTGGYPHSIRSDPHSYSVHYWSQEAYVIEKEMREQIMKMLDELDSVRPLPRKKEVENITQPRPEDFGERWYRELEDKKKKERGWKI